MRRAFGTLKANGIPANNRREFLPLNSARPLCQTNPCYSGGFFPRITHTSSNNMDNQSTDETT